MTAETIRLHLDYMRSQGQDWYVDGDEKHQGARQFYWRLLGEYLKG